MYTALIDSTSGRKNHHGGGWVLSVKLEAITPLDVYCSVGEPALLKGVRMHARHS